MRLSFLPLVLFVLALIGEEVSAVPKAAPCKPHNLNICLPKAAIPKSFRSKVTLNRGEGFLTPPEIYPGSFPANFPDEPFTSPITIPAGVTTATLCAPKGGKVECALITRFEDCPTEVFLADESGKSYICQVACTSRLPDANGNCDCSITSCQ